MKRLLFIATAPPLPATNGQRMRIWGLLRALYAVGYEVDLLAFADPALIAAHSEQLHETCRSVEAVPLKLASWSASCDYAARLFSLLSPLPYGVERFRSRDMAARIAARLQQPVDAVLIDSIYSAVNLPDRLDVPLILDDNNVEHMIVKRYLAQERNPLRRSYGWLECMKLRHWEHSVCARASLVMACSEKDRKELSELCPDVRISMVPNTIALEMYRPAPPRDDATLVYLGCMDWFPNRDAVAYFVTDILPELRLLAPQARLVVAFSPDHAPPVSVGKRFAGIAGIRFLQTNDVRSELGNATVFVVPLRIGSGTRFKILEAGAMAKAVVSTHIGAEGLDLLDRQEIWLEDDPAAFARAIAELLADAAAREALGRGARRRVEQQYGFGTLCATLSAALGRLEADVPFLDLRLTQPATQKSPVALCE